MSLVTLTEFPPGTAISKEEPYLMQRGGGFANDLGKLSRALEWRQR